MQIIDQYTIGSIVEHRLFGYRGVIFHIDPCFTLSDEWYEQKAKSRPPKDEPWYHILVHNGVHTTYVPQRNLTIARERSQIHHPALGEYFRSYNGFGYNAFEQVHSQR
jgi:heat shock protein HspQ